MRVLNYVSHTGAKVVEIDDGADVTYNISGNATQVAEQVAYLKQQYPVAGYVTRVIKDSGIEATVTRWNNCD